MKTFCMPFILMITLLLGCSNGPSEEEMIHEAIRMATSVKKMHFDVQEYHDYDDFDTWTKRAEALKPYYTEKAYQVLLANREHTLPLYVASEERAKISVKSMSMSIKSEPNQLEKLTFHYTMTVTVTYEDDDSSKDILIAGQMDIVQEDGTWKISRDWDDGSLLKEAHRKGES
ncbi:hypothetical protein [Brevibacillus sp. NRS-1366]|uniref:hypothetical protein n=1 Tax=Brevibacillus sp. NRS-1366 TaxID=3233899 RepID=UPI003D242809